MYIYNLQNFKESTFRGYLFSRSGNLIYDFARHPCFGNNWNNPKTGEYCEIYYYDYKHQRKKRVKDTINIKKIDFTKLPEDIQGLFYLYDKNIYAIKNSMSLYKWHQILDKYGESL